MRLAFLLATLLASTPVLAAEVRVIETNQRFDRESVTLKAGDALVVTNTDPGDHDLKLVDEDGDPQDVGLQKPGKVIRLSFPTAGAYKLRCTITPDMRMLVRVN